MIRILFVSSLFVYLLVIAANLAVPTSEEAEAIPSGTIPRRVVGPGPSPVASNREAPREPRVGCAINLHHTNRLDRYFEAINVMVDEVGFTHLEIITPVYQEHAGSPEVALLHGPGAGPYRDQLLTLLRHAQARGMRTALMPIVLLSDPVRNEWRGRIRPDNWDRWWRSYVAVMDYFVDVANEADVAMLAIGSELLAAEDQTRRWVALIRRIRKQYDGALTYSTNWDHFHVPQFWQHLDFIGMTAYWNLTLEAAEPAHPTLNELLARWGNIRADLLAFAHTHERPILFTELGYPSLPWGLSDPWNYVNPDAVPPAPNLQALGYKAFLAAWNDLLLREAPPNGHLFAGAYFYRWDPYHLDETDTGYGIQGKTTLELIKEFFKRSNRRINK